MVIKVVTRLSAVYSYQGLPYQMLIASLLHKYAVGHLEISRAYGITSLTAFLVTP